ncbi:MAG TPA: heavy metal-associated domain-containing protein [Lentimicrobium sp.]|nr:heavy metal-associated domain-containing protein [Lentimicrobium sp.]
MKRFAKITIAVLAVVLSGSLSAQESGKAEVDIKVSSQCSMCKETIERTLAFEKGVLSSSLDLETHTVKVVYRPGRTSPDKIRKAISKAGYDADELAADPKAYKKLPDCCKKPEDREFDHSGHDH